MSVIDISASDLRALLDSGADNPVLYVNRETDWEPELAVWDAAYVAEDDVVITRDGLVEWLGDDFTDEDVAEYLPELQEKVDEIAPEAGTHFTAWITTDPSSLAGDNADVTVLADKVSGWTKGTIDWASEGEQVFAAVTGVDARDGDDGDSIREGEDLLEAAGWHLVGTWEAVGTGYIATVERWGNETWTLAQTAEHIGASSAKYADTLLRRWGIKAIGRQPGRGGQNLYPAVEVMYAHATRPGQGARTDLQDR